MARLTFESSHWQLPSHVDPVADSSSAVDELQHREWHEAIWVEQQLHPSVTEHSMELAQQQVGIERTGSSRTATFKISAVSQRVVEQTYLMLQVYASVNRKAR